MLCVLSVTSKNMLCAICKISHAKQAGNAQKSPHYPPVQFCPDNCLGSSKKSTSCI